MINKVILVKAVMEPKLFEAMGGELNFFCFIYDKQNMMQ